MQKEFVELESIQDKDQKAIKDFREGKISSEDLTKIMSNNLKHVIGVIDTLGFPFKNKASDKAYTAAFLAVLHSGDITTMNEVIKLFINASTNEINKKDLAYLIDKEKVLGGQKQIYGTQYKINKDKTIDFLPIEDESNVNKRRKEMDMESLEQYKQFAEKFATINP